MKARTGIFLLAAWLALLNGCASSGSAPQTPSAIVSISPWVYHDSPNARVIHTSHYAIHTTISNTDFSAAMGALMEAALLQYQQFTPGVTVSSEPLECFVFQRRTEWAEFTADKTGDDAALYLQINRGGYTVRDWYVAYYIG